MKIRWMPKLISLFIVLCLCLAGCQTYSEKMEQEPIQKEQANSEKEMPDQIEVKDGLKEHEEIDQEKEEGKEEKKERVQGNVVETKDEIEVSQEDNVPTTNEEEAKEDETIKTKIVVYKAERKLELWQEGSLTNTYPIGLAKDADGKKEKEGDRKTPEGEYYVCTKNQYSKFYLSLGVSYPNVEDAQNALSNGLIEEETYQNIVDAIQKGECPPWNTALGGEIMIHGHGGDKDWTKGCVAVDNEVMDVLFEVCQIGTPITIYP